MKIKFRSLYIALFLTLSGCVPYFYEGKFANIRLNNELNIARREISYGDCYRFFPPVPTVLEINKPNYRLVIVHGHFYSPRLYFSALSPQDEFLKIEGINIYQIPAHWDIQKIQQLRATKVTHGLNSGKPTSISQENSPIELTILNPEGVEIGSEKIEFDIIKINCLGIHAL